MGDVRITEQQIVRADAGRQALVGAAVDRRVFAENIVIADFEKRGLADVFEVLRLPADRREREKLVPRPKRAFLSSTTCEWSTQSSPSSTFAPTTQ